jgi:hypothetical protein
MSRAGKGTRDLGLTPRGREQARGVDADRSGLSKERSLARRPRLCGVQSPGSRPYLLHIHHGTLETRVRRPDDRPDAVLWLPASTLTQLLYRRIGPFTAVGRGLRIVGGRGPWVALKLMSYLERARPPRGRHSGPRIQAANAIRDRAPVTRHRAIRTGAQLRDGWEISRPDPGQAPLRSNDYLQQYAPSVGSHISQSAKGFSWPTPTTPQL